MTDGRVDKVIGRIVFVPIRTYSYNQKDGTEDTRSLIQDLIFFRNVAF